MKQLMISTVLTVMCLLGIVTNANAQAGSYNGTLSNVTMNGKLYDNVTGQDFELTSLGNNLYRLTGEFGPIGKMPGTIYVDVNIAINNGVITSSTPINGVAGYLAFTIGGSINIKLSSLTGTLVNNNLHFVLNTYAGWQSLPIFPASVTFDGTLQP